MKNKLEQLTEYLYARHGQQRMSQDRVRRSFNDVLSGELSSIFIKAAIDVMKAHVAYLEATDSNWWSKNKSDKLNLDKDSKMIYTLVFFFDHCNIRSKAIDAFHQDQKTGGQNLLERVLLGHDSLYQKFNLNAFQCQTQPNFTSQYKAYLNMISADYYLTWYMTKNSAKRHHNPGLVWDDNKQAYKLLALRPESFKSALQNCNAREELGFNLTDKLLNSLIPKIIEKTNEMRSQAVKAFKL